MVVMLFGIGFLSVLTATIASLFVKTERGDETEEILAALTRLEADWPRSSGGLPRLPDRRLSEGRRLVRLAEPLGPGRSDVTSQGHPRAIFRRVLERETLLVAEATAKEIGRLSLDEALELTLLIARRHPRVAGLSYRPRFTFMKGL